MIKTLRITTVIAALAAAGLLVFCTVLGVRRDEQAEMFLKSASAIEKFAKEINKKPVKSQGRLSPLVKQAEEFALYLDPPKAASPGQRITAPPRLGVKRPAAVSAKFTLVGTSYFAERPELSLALIDQPGEGLRWVRQSSEIGHLTIEQIKEGLVSVRDGQKTYDLEVIRPEEISLVKTPPASKSQESRPGSEADKTKQNKAEASGDLTKTLQDTRSDLESKEEPEQDEAESREDIMKTLHDMRSELEGREGTEIIDDFIAKLSAESQQDSNRPQNTVRKAVNRKVSHREAKRLERLGRDLNDFKNAKTEPSDENEPSEEPNTPQEQ